MNRTQLKQITGLRVSCRDPIQTGNSEHSHLWKMSWQRLRSWPLSQFCTLEEPEISMSEIWSIWGPGDGCNLLLHQKPLYHKGDKVCCYGARHNCFSIFLAFSTKWHPYNTSELQSAEHNSLFILQKQIHGAPHAQQRLIPFHGWLQHVNMSQIVPTFSTYNASLHCKLLPTHTNRKHGYLNTT